MKSFRPLLLFFLPGLVAASAGWAQTCNTIIQPPHYNGALPPQPPSVAPPALPAPINLCPTDPVTNGLVGRLKFDEGSGSTAADSSGNGNSGTLANNPTWIAGHIGSGALQFDGNSNYVIFAQGKPINDSGSAAHSVAAWFKTTGSGIIVGSDSVAPPSTQDVFNPMLYIENNGKLHGGGWKNGVPNLESASAVNDDNWHYAVYVYEGTGGNQLLYLDGSLVNSVSGNLFGINNGYWTVGTGLIDSGWPNNPGAGNGSWFYFNGKIDDVRFYNRALSAAEVQALYNYTGP